MIHQVYDALKEDSRSGDFKALTDKDRKELDIKYSDEDIEAFGKVAWKKYIKEKVTLATLNYLVAENSTKEKTKHIPFTELKMSDYLKHNISTVLSRIIFSVRSQTLDIKTNRPWSYYTEICETCENEIETMDHCMTCMSYESITCRDWRKIYSDDENAQLEVGHIVEKRHTEREIIINKKKVGWALDSDSSAPGDC